MQIPKWLTRNEDNEFPPMPISTAVIPMKEIKMEEEMPQTNGNGIAPSPTLSVSEQLRSAAAEAERHEADRAKWSEAYAKVAETIKDLRRECEFLRLELATRNNDMQTAQATIEELRQANSDLRALHGALHAQAKHLVAQYENFSIPLPIRSRVKRNGKLEKAARSESTVTSERAVMPENTTALERTVLGESTITKE